MKKDLIERANDYWDWMNTGDTTTAKEMFSFCKLDSPAQDIKYIKEFLTKKVNQLRSVLVCNKPERLFQKLSDSISLLDFYKTVFNTLPTKTVLTVSAFMNIIPPKARMITNVRNFLYRAKISGCLINMCDDNGNVLTSGRQVKVKKVANITKFKRGGKIGREIIPTSPKQVETIKKAVPEIIIPDEIAKLKVNDVGISIFSLINSLMTENQLLQKEIKFREDKIKSLTASENDLFQLLEEKEAALGKYKDENKTYAEVIKDLNEATIS